MNDTVRGQRRNVPGASLQREDPSRQLLLPPPRPPALGLSKSTARTSPLNTRASPSLAPRLRPAAGRRRGIRTAEARSGATYRGAEMQGPRQALGCRDISATLDGLPGLPIASTTPIYNFTSIYLSFVIPPEREDSLRYRINWEETEAILTNYSTLNLYALSPKTVLLLRTRSFVPSAHAKDVHGAPGPPSRSSEVGTARTPEQGHALCWTANSTVSSSKGRMPDYDGSDHGRAAHHEWDARPQTWAQTRVPATSTGRV